MRNSGRPTTNERKPLFVQPKPRKRREHAPLSWPPADWREHVPPALVRAFAAIAFAAIPSFDERFGDLALPGVCVALAVLAALIALFTHHSEAARVWPLNATDSVTLVLLVPALAVASGIAVADVRLGGQASNFFAAAVAVVGTTLIVATAAALTSIRTLTTAALALLPAPLLVTVAMAGAERFAASSLPQGLSAAWMIAALATLIDGLVEDRIRPLIPVAAFSVFTVVVALLAQSGEISISSTNNAIAFATTGLAGLMILVTGPAAARAREFVTEPLPDAENPDLR